MENLQAMIESMLPGVPVHAVRFPDAATARGPSILWRTMATDRPDTIDVAASGSPVVEFECRAPTCPGAQNIAADILDRLQRAGRLNRVLDQYDEPDDASQQRGKYFSHILRIELAA